MPDPVQPAPDQPQNGGRSWPETLERIFDKSLKFIAPFVIAYFAYLGNKTVTKTEQVQSQQTQQVETAEEVKTALEKKAAAERVALESNLRASWKYLEQVADESGMLKDREAANTAKRAYEEFKARNGGH